MGAPSDGTPLARTARVAAEARSKAAAITGDLFRSLIRDALSLLEQHVETLNAINVFPVPDGDTGTNMRLTLRAAVNALPGRGGIGEVVSALGQGALMGARGNSGVILSQVLRGVATGLEGRDVADGPSLADALARGAEAARRALSEPKEGTILTVVRAAAEAAAEARDGPVEEVLAAAVGAADEAVERTPELLPVLKEAGVVDAGGLGLALILRGLLQSLRGEPLEARLPAMEVRASWRSEAASLHEGGEEDSGYCAEFVVTGQRLDLEEARARLNALGSSVLVVGGDGLLRVHLHTMKPDDALALVRSLGELSGVKVDNLEAQIRDFVTAGPSEPITPGLDVVAVAAGEGIEAAFRSLGVTHLVAGGQTMNPSAGEILEAVERCAAGRVVVLPNNKNVIGAAQQAAEGSPKHVAVLPSRTIPQGMAAVLALNADLPFEANLEAMERAIVSIHSAEVTRAVRSTVVDGRRVEIGQAIGLVDSHLDVVEDSVEEAVRACVRRLRSTGDLGSTGSLLTLYAGSEVRRADAEALADELRREFSDLQVEAVAGGQPHYPYILSLE